MILMTSLTVSWIVSDLIGTSLKCKNNLARNPQNSQKRFWIHLQVLHNKTSLNKFITTMTLKSFMKICLEPKRKYKITSKIGRNMRKVLITWLTVWKVIVSLISLMGALWRISSQKIWLWIIQTLKFIKYFSNPWSLVKSNTMRLETNLMALMGKDGQRAQTWVEGHLWFKPVTTVIECYMEQIKMKR